MDFNCGNSCTASAPAWDAPTSWAVTAGNLDSHVATTTIDYEWSGNETPGSIDFLDPTSNFSAMSPKYGKSTTAQWLEPTLQVRCDNVAGSYSGCVFPKFIPTYTVNTGKYPAAAAMYWLMMENLDPAHPGSAKFDKPLHRLADTVKQQANRAIICDNTYQARAETPNASCDEYPFAASRESGGAALTSGNQCVQLYAAPSGTSWQVKYDDNYALPNWSAPCGRGSIPLDQNRGAGGGVGGLVSKARLLDDDPYYVATPGFENCNPNTSCVVTP